MVAVPGAGAMTPERGRGDARHAAGANAEGKTKKSARTRARILAAASQLIAERGNVEFQMAEVAERCDMSKGSLYYYFRDRDAIIEEIFETDIDAFVSRIEASIADDVSPTEALEAACAEFARSIRDGETVVAAIASDLVRGGSGLVPNLGERFQRLANLVEVQVRRGKEEGLVRADIDAEIVASMLVGSFLFAAIDKASRTSRPFDVESFAAELMSFVRHGLGG